MKLRYHGYASNDSPNKRIVISTEAAGFLPVAKCPPASGREKSIYVDFSTALHSK